ncbi:Rieske 2Fe-2S domain-containing protein [Methylibium sp.]|uniref:aromatic ring-hydroxylating dioxygenase subunit alpha n=1 Tax=Methylibium sp. TaxID=2067992 RepID=UPI003D0A3062
MSTFLKDCWYVAAFADELGGRPVGRTLLNEPIVLFRRTDGLPAALEDRCCHRGLPLALGELVPEGIRCGYHGLVFDGCGVCVKVPGQDTIPSAARVANYPVAERDGLVWIWLGDPAKADVNMIPRYEWHAAPGWAHRGKRNEVQADHLLVADNLLDLTHVGYVHKSTIGGQPDAHSNAEMNFSRTGDSVSVVRWLRNSLPPPTYVAAHGFTGRVDRWIEIDFRPGLITINAGAKDVDTGACEGRRDGGFSLRSLHALTPASEGVSHYFWTIAHEVKPGMPDLTDRVYQEIDTAFAEDKFVLEAQYARLRQKPTPPLVDIKSDAPSIHARRIVAMRSGSAMNTR